MTVKMTLGRILVLCLGLCLLPAGCSPGSNAGRSGAKQPPDTGTLDLVNDKVIEGWAWNRAQPQEIVKVDLFDGETLLGTVSADLFRKDLLEHGIGDGKHKFSFPTPENLKDGKPHTIRATISGTKTELRNSPKVFEHKG